MNLTRCRRIIKTVSNSVQGCKGPVPLIWVLTCYFAHISGLLEAMEQQQVSIAKAGVVASLPARCSIIAAANPRHGSYSMSKSVSENLNMAQPILSRFDLVFILRDRADKEQDRLVSSNIMNLYRNANSNQNVSLDRRDLPRQSHGIDGAEHENRMTLSARLAWVMDFQKQPLPAELVRDYIAYAREYCKPKMTPEAAAVLKDYFMDLR
jgi:DNA helicase MCM8